MATRMSKGAKAPAKTKTTKTATTKPVEKADEIIKKPVEAEKKVFDNTDLIRCKSITNGELLVIGKRTGILYKWAGYGDIEEMEYQDLTYELRSGGNNSIVMKPYFIVLDDDFVSANSKLNDMYNSIYSIEDIEAVLELSPKEMKKVIPELPVGVKQSLKGLAATRVEEKTLTDLNVIKALDEVFGTNLLLTVVTE